MTSEKNSALIDQIYDSVGHSGGIEETMASVSRHLGAQAAFWYVLPRGADRGSAHNPFLFNGFHGFNADNVKVFNAEMWRHDYALNHASITDRTTETHELISREDAARSDYVNWLKETEGLDRRIARSTEFATGTVAGWAFHISAGIERRPSERANFDALAPHIRQMFRLSSLFGEAHMRVDSLQEVIRDRGQAIVLLDGDGTVRWASEAALRLSGENDGLGCEQGRLTFARSRERQEFELILAHARRPELTNGAGAEAQIFVERPSGKRPYMVHLTLAPAAFRQQLHSRSAFIVTISDLAAIVDGRPELWRALFGLTPKEAHVALSSMRGLDDASIARLEGIGVGTVRTHQRHILSKTGTRTKAELAHLLTSLS
jgi:DNA-binding CsgD family transcriptional regulator